MIILDIAIRKYTNLKIVMYFEGISTNKNESKFYFK